MSDPSTKPYLIRAIHQWCMDNGYRPYLVVTVDERTQVPHEFVRNGEIVLNVSDDATHRLTLGNDLIEFEARFNQVARQISIPVDNVSAIYAAENGQGMAFEVRRAEGQGDEKAKGQEPVAERPAPVRSPAQLSRVPASSRAKQESYSPDDPPPPGRPKLTRIK
ncbi:MAG: ClpXP protease specificity-enhancing factor [Quisquiliibacterium sp.]